jgi:hypothetical protein
MDIVYNECDATLFSREQLPGVIEMLNARFSNNVVGIEMRVVL